MAANRPLMHFSKHLFLASKVYAGRNKAKDSVEAHLKRMRKSIIKMRLSYTDVDRLREKIHTLISFERKYSRFFKHADSESEELRNQINELEQTLRNEEEEKQRIIEESNEKVRQLTESLDNLTNQTKFLFIEKTKRQQRLRALEQKIRGKVDVEGYYER